MIYDLITVGAAVQDVYLSSDAFTVGSNAEYASGQEACFMLGGKVEVDRPVFSSGGGAGNAAATFAHMGHSVACAAMVGADEGGRHVERDLVHHGVHTHLLQTHKTEPTGYSVLLTTPDGQRTALVYRGASLKLDASTLPWKKMCSRWLYITSLHGDLATLKKLLAHAAKHDIRVAWNPGHAELSHGLHTLSPLLAKTDLLIVNREEGALLTKRAPSDLNGILEDLRNHSGEYVLLSDGKRGAYALNKQVAFHAAPNDIPVKNATGSGDALGAGFLAGILAYDNIATALQLGALNAESVIQEVGAKHGLLPRRPGTRALGSIHVSPYLIS